MYRSTRFLADLARAKREFWQLETTKKLMATETPTYLNACANEFALEKVYSKLEKRTLNPVANIQNKTTGPLDISLNKN